MNQVHTVVTGEDALDQELVQVHADCATVQILACPVGGRQETAAADEVRAAEVAVEQAAVGFA